MRGSGGVLVNGGWPALVGGLLLFGCGAPQGTGAETQGCEEGQCLGGLMCLSDLCVDPQWEPDAMTGDTTPDRPGPGSPPSTAGTSGPDESSEVGETGETEEESTASAPGEGCGSVDVLLVIDNTASMQAEQGRLEAALPVFFDALEVATGTASHHVMVVDTDAWLFEGCEEVICPILGACWSVWPGYVCGETTALVCEDVLGAGVTHPRGIDAANTDCAFGGQRFVELAEHGARDRIACAARVGTSGGPEAPMAAMLAAVGAIGDAGNCNEGFARRERPLVVVFATDEEDGLEGSQGAPTQWHEQLIGSRDAPVFVLGLVGDHNQPSTPCMSDAPEDPFGAEPSPRLWEFVERFGSQGVLASVCAEDYGPALEAIAGVVQQSCEG